MGSTKLSAYQVTRGEQDSCLNKRHPIPKAELRLRCPVNKWRGGWRDKKTGGCVSSAPRTTRYYVHHHHHHHHHELNRQLTCLPTWPAYHMCTCPYSLSLIYSRVLSPISHGSLSQGRRVGYATTLSIRTWRGHGMDSISDQLRLPAMPGRTVQIVRGSRWCNCKTSTTALATGLVDESSPGESKTERANKRVVVVLPTNGVRQGPESADRGPQVPCHNLLQRITLNTDSPPPRQGVEYHRKASRLFF